MIAHVPTDRSRKTVLALRAYGAKHEDIATVLDISADTLVRHYKIELERGLIDANAKVAENLFRIATSNEKTAVAAAIFWLKCRAKWRSSEVDDVLKELDTLRSKLIEAEERLSRLGTPRLVG